MSTRADAEQAYYEVLAILPDDLNITESIDKWCCRLTSKVTEKSGWLGISNLHDNHELIWILIDPPRMMRMLVRTAPSDDVVNLAGIASSERYGPIIDVIVQDLQ